MGLLGRIAASVGGWLVKEGEEQDAMAMEKMKDDIIASREVALEGVKAQYAAQTEAAAQKGRLAVVDETGAQQRATDLVNAAATGANQAAHDARDATIQQANIAARGAIDMKIEKLRESGALTQDAYKAALDRANALFEANNKVGDVKMSPKGELGFYSETGKLLSQTPVGTVDPNSGKPNALAALGLPGSTAGAGPSTSSLISANAAIGSGQGTPAAPAVNSQKAAAVAALGSAYSAAQGDPATYKNIYPGMFDAQGNLKPQQELLDQINTTYGGQ